MRNIESGCHFLKLTGFMSLSDSGGNSSLNGLSWDPGQRNSNNVIKLRSHTPQTGVAQRQVPNSFQHIWVHNGQSDNALWIQLCGLLESLPLFYFILFFYIILICQRASTSWMTWCVIPETLFSCLLAELKSEHFTVWTCMPKSDI